MRGSQLKIHVSGGGCFGHISMYVHIVHPTLKSTKDQLRIFKGGWYSSSSGILPLECRSLLLTNWHQWVEAFFPSCPGHTVPKAFARSVVLKFSLTPALVIVILVKASHGELVLSPTRIFAPVDLTSLLPHDGATISDTENSLKKCYQAM